jgi:hypothetical protein
MDQNILDPLPVVIMVTGCGISQIDFKTVDLLVSG